MNDLIKAIEDGFADLGHHDASMRRSRPYSGQPWTDFGVRGSTEIRGITLRDLRDAFIRAVCQSSDKSHLQVEADKGESAALSSADVYEVGDVDLMAVSQNLSCEIEKLMGIFPNLAGCPSTDQIMRDLGITDPGQS